MLYTKLCNENYALKRANSMKISTKGRYALRLMLDLAMHADEGCISIKTIANRQGISEKYLEQIIKPLAAAGFVESTRGKQEHRCENCADCVTYEVWQNVLDAINEAVDSITLAYLVEKQKTKKTTCNHCNKG